MTHLLELTQLLPYALLSSLLMSVAFGYVGSFLVLKRQGFLTDTIAHASLLGVAIGYFLGVAPQSVLIPFSLVLGLGLTWMSLRSEQDIVAISAVIFSTCAGLGALILGIKGVGGQEFVHVLLGDLLWVGKGDFLLFLFISIGVSLFVFLNSKKLTLLILDRETAIASGIPTALYEYGFTACIALLIAVSIKLVGVFLVTSLVAVPPLIAARMVKSFKMQLVVSIIASVVLTLVGFFVALAWDLPFGPAISALLGGTAFLCQFKLNHIFARD